MGGWGCPAPLRAYPTLFPVTHRRSPVSPALLGICLLILILTGSHAQCPQGVEHDGKCYVIQMGATSWDSARSGCQRLSGTLPVIADDVTHDVITRLMREERIPSIWLGAMGKTLDWHWASSGAVIGPQGCYQDSPWSPDLELLTTIPDMTPNKCLTKCRDRGSPYAAIQSKVYCYCGNTYGRYGLVGNSGTCTITCPGNSQYCGGWGKNSVYSVNGKYGNWSYLQPDGDNDACAVMDTSGNDRKFADEHCYREEFYICDINQSSCHPTETGFYVRGDVCLYVSNDVRTWWEAKYACSEKGGSLLEVKNAEHHDVIRNVLNVTGIDVRLWIGLTRSEWTWSDQDTSFSWTGWAARSPSGRKDRCLSITNTSGYKWVDSQCNEQLVSVCAIATEKITTEGSTLLSSPPATMVQTSMITTMSDNETKKPTTILTNIQTSRSAEATTGSILQSTSTLADISSTVSQKPTAATMSQITVRNSTILSTLASTTIFSDMTTSVVIDVNLTFPTAENSTTDPNAVETTDDDEDKGSMSTVEIVVVAGLVALAFALATSMVVFLSCKKRAGCCKSKSNKTDSVLPAVDPFPVDGATGIHLVSGNDGIQNGGSHGAPINRITEKQRRKSEQYGIDATAETKDLTTMEDISVAIGDPKRGKKQKGRRNSSLLNGVPGSRGRTGPGPPSTWSTLPRYYYGMEGENGAYHNGSYGNHENADPELMQQALPPIQDVHRSQSYLDTNGGVNNSSIQNPGAKGPLSTGPALTSGSPICILDANGLYEASSYYDGFNPDQNTYSSTFPRQVARNSPDVDYNNTRHPEPGDQIRRYEQSVNMQHPGLSNRYERNKSHFILPRTNLPIYKREAVGRADSLSSHHSMTDDTASSSASPSSEHIHDVHVMMQRTQLDAVQNAEYSSRTPSSNARYPPGALRTSRTGLEVSPESYHSAPAHKPPRLPGAIPLKRAPPAPPPRKSSRNNAQVEQNVYTNLNGHQQELNEQTAGPKIFMVNAEEGITWC